MPPAGAGRIRQDPGRAATAATSPDDLRAVVGPALRILQLNVEGLSAAKRSIIGFYDGAVRWSKKF